MKKNLHDIEQFRYVHLWDWPLRVLHWLWVLCIIGLSLTGICIIEGWILMTGPQSGGFLFGGIRFIHYALGWAFIVIMMLRFICFFTASNKYQRFSSLFPVSKNRIKDLLSIARHYAMARSDEGPRYLGHNPLQQWSYTAVYALFLLMIVSGLCLYALYAPTHWFYGLFMPLNELIGIPNMRLIHAFGMWAVIIFAICHVYLSILADNEDRDGTVSSMFSGGRWARKGAKFNDEQP